MGVFAGLLLTPHITVNWGIWATLLCILVAALIGARLLALSAGNPDLGLSLALCLGIAGSFGLAINLILQIPGAPILALAGLGLASGMFLSFYTRGL